MITDEVSTLKSLLLTNYPVVVRSLNQANHPVVHIPCPHIGGTNFGSITGHHVTVFNNVWALRHIQ